MAGYIGTQAVSVNTTSATISDDLTVGDDATITGDLDVDGTTNLDVTNIVGNLTVTGDTATFTSANSNDPNIIFKNTTNDANAPIMDFITDKGAAGADNDSLGLIRFTGDNDAQQQTTFARVLATVADASDGAEGGKLELQVATHDGEIKSGFVINDGNAEDEIDVTIGSGTSSLTSVAGNIDVTGTAQIDGNTTVGTATSSTNVELSLNGVANKAQRIQFKEGGTNRWLLGQGAASETSAFEIFNAAGVISLAINRSTNLATFANGITLTDGDLVVSTNGHGINFAGPTAQSGGTSQTLDSYEEGTFTPSCAFQNTTNNNAKNIDSQIGSYIKIGEFVYFNLNIVLDVPGSLAADNFVITSLPFTSRNVSGLDQPQPFLMQGIATTTPLFLDIPHNSTTGTLVNNNLGANQGNALNTANNQTIIVCGSYRVA